MKHFWELVNTLLKTFIPTNIVARHHRVSLAVETPQRSGARAGEGRLPSVGLWSLLSSTFICAVILLRKREARQK